MGKNVFIVGASGDIGKAIAKQLAKDDYHLILHYHQNKEAIMNLTKKLDPEQVLAVIQGDLANQADIERMLNEIVFPVDILIFASGMAHYGLFQDLTIETIEKMLMIHVQAPLIITKHFLPEMIQRQSGNIIFITSIWGSIGASFEVLYSTVKGAQNSFIKSLAKEVAPSGITVNGVSPGFIDTKMNDHLQLEEKSAIVADIPMQRSGTVEEVAHVVRFLCDEETTYIQGEIINITGGWY